MLSCSICSNSLFVTCKRSGARRRGRADTGGPTVSIWCVMSCRMGVSGEHTLVRDGNSDSSWRYGLTQSLGHFEGLGEFSMCN